MDVKLLEEIGLTAGEVKVYLALLKLGASKTGPLVSLAGVSSSKVYKILDRLEKKGLVGHVLKESVKHFVAMEPRRILDYIDEKESQLNYKKQLVEQMLPELARQREAGQKTEAAVYDGFKAVTNFFRNILDELKPGETYYVIGAGYGENVPGLRPFFFAHHNRRRKRGIKLKMLANSNVKDNIEETTKFAAEIRYLPAYLITNMEIVFYRSKAFIAFWTRDPKGFLIESEEAVKSFRAYFNTFWKIAKP